jgi:pyrimidine deaminase RibD-like protein
VSEVTDSHERFMRRCIELAREAKQQGNTPVGSVVVLDGGIMGEGMEQLPARLLLTGHAEALACQHAVEQTRSRLLRRATLYSTAEPCFSRVNTASMAIRCRISLTVVQQSGKIVMPYFSAALEIAVWVTQFWVIIPHTSNSVTPSLASVSSRFVFSKPSANSFTTIGALEAAARIRGWMSAPGVPSLKKGAIHCLATCWIWITGMP